nr:putative ribonuclease H-like domain-containing protein [Tanacetum cinerariifolium]
MENKPNVVGSGPVWLFDIDSLTQTMNYLLVAIENQTNTHADSQINNKDVLVDGKKHDDNIQKSMSPDNHSSSIEFEECINNSSNEVNAAGSSVIAAGFNFTNSTNDFSAAGPSNTAASPPVENSALQNVSTSSHDADMPNLEDYAHSDDADDVGAEADINNLESTILVSPIPTSRIHKDHPTSQIIGDLSLTTQTRSMAKAIKDQVDLPYGKRAIGTKWVYRNTKDERCIVVRNKARLVSQGHTQEEGIDYEEVLAPVARIEAIRLFLAYASFIGFLVYQMNVKSAFLYGTIEEEVYVCQPPGFEDPEYPDKVYKVVKALYGLHQAPRA